MKLFPAVALLTIAAATLTPASPAQGVALKANIPFNFTVGNQDLPSGEYTITSPIAGVIRVASADHHYAATVVSSKGLQDSHDGNKLLFNHYGNEYFLHQILCPQLSQMNVNIPSWEREHRARSREAKLQTPDTTLVAAR